MKASLRIKSCTANLQYVAAIQQYLCDKLDHFHAYIYVLTDSYVFQRICTILAQTTKGLGW